MNDLFFTDVIKFVCKTVRGDDAFDSALLNRRQPVLLGEDVIEIDRNLAEDGYRQIDKCGRN